MILPIMYPLIFTEMLLILILMFSSPLRNLAIKGLDRLKLGKGPVVAQTLMGTLVVLFVSSSYGIYDVHRRLIDAPGVNPTDQILMAYHLLEATLLGISLFLAVLIDRQHYYMREIQRLTSRPQVYSLPDQTTASFVEG